MIYCASLPPDRSNLIREHDWSRSLVARALGRAFTPPPDGEIWEWADETVLLQNEDAAEPGEYRSSKTPWVRRLQEVIRNPFTWCWDFNAQEWIRVPVNEFNVQKSSQSGFSEGCLNGIRWKAVFRPCNVIYAIDSAEEAKKIARRLLRSFKFLDQTIFTGDPDDIKTLEFQLRGMELLFYGSFSTGKFANKQAPLLISDEVDEHGKFILRDLSSRKKTSTGGLQVNLSKPKIEGGPINLAFKRGNQEEYFVPCPHCGHMQFLTFFPEEIDIPFSDVIDEIKDEQTGKVVARLPRPLPLGEKRKIKTGRIVYEHCKNLLGKWDRMRILNETYYECADCKGAIDEGSKRWMLDRAEWRPMEVDCSPGVVSQHISDLYSEDELSSWGLIVQEYLDAREESHDALQAFYNHRLGRPWKEEANTTEPSTIIANISGRSIWFVDAPNTSGQIVRNIYHDQPSADRLSAANLARGLETPVIHSACPAYQRGTIPFQLYKAHPKAPGTLILGSDVGGNYARWVVIGVHTNLRDCAVIDWGEELDPDSIRAVAFDKTWTIRGTGEKCRVVSAWIDARWRPGDVYKACLGSRGLMIPTKGLGGAAAINVKLWAYVHVPSYHPNFYELHYNDQRAKDALYLDRFKRMRRRLWVPVDVEEDPTFIEELCAERQKQNRRGQWIWDEEITRPNHYGDGLKEATIGLDFMTRNVKPPDALPVPPSTPASASLTSQPRDNG